MSLSFAPLVKDASPAVVNIYTKRVIKSQRSPFLTDPFFQQFFGKNFFNFGAPRRRVENSLGSGVIVRDTGIIVTNYHVIKGANQITVVLSDRRELSAKIMLTDEKTDLAVLRVNTGGERLPFLKLRNSDHLEVGDLVLAIGNPFGVGQTVTSGIVSAVARAAEGVSDFSFFIQTDAAINPGNSGGALLSMDGRLAGINTAIYSKSGGSQGIGFAVPANMVARVIESALVGSSRVSPWLGALGQQVTTRLATNLGLKRPVGILINKIYPGGPAARAGLIVGDIVTSINGFEVVTPAALRYRIATLQVGKVAILNIWRNSKIRQVSLPLERAPEVPLKEISQLNGVHPFAGATVANMSPALAEDLSLKLLSRGVIILNIRRQSPAFRLGLQEGDFILEINGKNIDSVNTVKKVLKINMRRWAITIKRNGKVFKAVIE